MKISHIVQALWQLGSDVMKQKAKENMSTIKDREFAISHAGDEAGIYDHQVLTIEESWINRLLRARLRHHWLWYSLIIEFEPNNRGYVAGITKMGNVMSANFTIEDVWFDDYTTSIGIKLDVDTVDTGYFILNTLIHIIGKWLMSFLGTFFNPFSIGALGSTMRFEKDGKMHFDLVPHSEVRGVIPWPKREEHAKGPVLLYNPRTVQAAIRLDYYAFYAPEEKYEIKDIPKKTSWLHSIDWMALLLLPFGVWISSVFLHRYMPAQTIQSFSWSMYFWMSLGMLWISFMVMNIPRYIYMYVEGRKKWQSTYIHNNITVQMRRLQRRILNQQAKLEAEGNEKDADYQGTIRNLLLQIRDKRFLMKRLTVIDDDHLRKQKVKFIIVYILCTLFEWVLVMN